MKNIKVSIVCISYNQEKYIAQALDSFVSQKTDFDFEAIITDDCSTDSTSKIINEYAKKYPNIIKTVLRKKNIGVQANFVDALKRATGDYIALCEGDDFWTDEHKLQRQVDFLDRNDDYSLCFHPVSVIYDKNEQPDAIFPAEKDGFTLKKLLKSNYIQTNSVMYRRREYDSIPLNILPLDWYLHLFHAQFGKIGFIDKVMSSYRRHEGGMWWSAQEDEKDGLWKQHGVALLAQYLEQMRLYGEHPAYKIIIENRIVRTIEILLRIDSSQGTTLLEDSFGKNSRCNAEIVAVMPRVLSGLSSNNRLLADRNEKLRNSIDSLRADISLIRSSKRYIYAEKIANLLANLRNGAKRFKR